MFRMTSYPYIYNTSNLVGGLEHESYFPECMGCRPKPIDELIFFKMVKSPPTIYIYIYNYIYIYIFNGLVYVTFYRKTPYE